jgi:hypothetical protein
MLERSQLIKCQWIKRHEAVERASKYSIWYSEFWVIVKISNIQMWLMNKTSKVQIEPEDISLKYLVVDCSKHSINCAGNTINVQKLIRRLVLK